jgi:nucleoside phosphorylase
MKSMLLLIEGDDELRPVVKELQAVPVTGAQHTFERTLSNRTKIIAVTSGVGPEQAYQVTADAIRKFSPDYVLSAGTCGALVQGIEVSDWVVTGDIRAIDQANRQWSTLETLRVNDTTAVPRLCQALKQTPRWHKGRLVTVADEPIHCAMAKAEIATLHEAIAVDMESYGIARAAVEKGLPWVVARVVVDTPAVPLPDLGAMNVRTGRPPLSGIAQYVLMNPIAGPRDCMDYGRWCRPMRFTLSECCRNSPMVRGCLARDKSVNSCNRSPRSSQDNSARDGPR